MAVLLVEPSAYKIDLSTATQPVDEDKAPTKKRKGVRGRGRPSKPKKQKGAGGKKYADARGAKRGSRGRKQDVIYIQEQPQIDLDALNEGLYMLVQTGTCRRLVLTEIYANETPHKCKSRKDARIDICTHTYSYTDPTVPCCDICHPQLLELTRPGIAPMMPRQKAVKRGVPCEAVQDRLARW